MSIGTPRFIRLEKIEIQTHRITATVSVFSTTELIGTLTHELPLMLSENLAKQVEALRTSIAEELTSKLWGSGQPPASTTQTQEQDNPFNPAPDPVSEPQSLSSMLDSFAGNPRI